MATSYAYAVGSPASLSAAQTGTGVCTNIGARRTDAGELRPGLLKLVATAGTTCTYAFEMSPDGSYWFPMLYRNLVLTAAGGAPGALTSAQIGASGALTVTTTLLFLLDVDIPWQFLRCTYSANTGFTNTLDLWMF